MAPNLSYHRKNNSLTWCRGPLQLWTSFSIPLHSKTSEFSTLPVLWWPLRFSSQTWRPGESGTNISGWKRREFSKSSIQWKHTLHNEEVRETSSEDKQRICHRNRKELSVQMEWWEKGPRDRKNAPSKHKCLFIRKALFSLSLFTHLMNKAKATAPSDVGKT